SCLSSKLKSSSAPIGREDSWCFHAVGSSNAPLLGSTAAEGLPRIGRTSIATHWRSCGLPQSASCSENFVIPPDVFGQTLSAGPRDVHTASCARLNANARPARRILPSAANAVTTAAGSVGSMPKSDLPMSRRNWPRYARALDMHLAGHKLDDIAHELGVTRERARQMVIDAGPAISCARKSILDSPGIVTGYRMLVLNCALIGEIDEARAALKIVKRQTTRDVHSHADECVRLAGLTDDLIVRDQLLVLAQEWMLAARRARRPSDDTRVVSLHKNLGDNVVPLHANQLHANQDD